MRETRAALPAASASQGGGDRRRVNASQACRVPHLSYGPRLSISLGIVVGVMMISYVAVPSRLIGIKPTRSKRDRLTASALGGALSATVCTPPYLLGRLGILMLGSRVLLIPGILLLTVGFTLQAGATGAVRAIKMSATLTAGAPPSSSQSGSSTAA